MRAMRLHRMGILLALGLVIGGLAVPAVPRACAQGNDVTVTIDQVDTSSFPTVQVRMRVRNRNGQPIADLRPENFQIVEDGRQKFTPAALEEVENNPNARVSLAIVIDIYSRLKGAPLDAAKQATEDLLTDLLNEPNDPDRAAYIGVRKGMTTDPNTIDDEYEVPFTNDRGRLLNEIRFLDERIASGGTPLYDAVVKAVRLAAATEPIGQRAVIVMTDGCDAGSISKEDDPIWNARDTGTPVFTVGIGDCPGGEQYLKRLADQTGGAYQRAKTPEEFSPLFMNVLTMLRTQYVLTYESALPQDGEEHSLLFHVRTPTQMNGSTEWKIETPTQPSAPPPATAESPTATPKGASGGKTPTPTATPAPPAEGEEDLLTQVRNWVQENKLLAVLIIAGAGLLFLILVVIIIVVVSRRAQPVEEELPSAPEIPAPTPPFKPAAGLPSTGPLDSALTPAMGVPLSPTPAAGPTPFTEIAPPPGVVGTIPAAPPPMQPAAPPQQPAPPGGTRILTRAPKMPVVGMLIERKRPDRRYDVNRPQVNIGRGQGNDVLIEHDTVSRQHAAIKLEGTEFRLYDLGSSNGSFVNEKRVREPATLADGDIVRFGEVECVFKIVSLQ